MRKHETVSCVFKNCDHSTNIYSTFAAHKSRKHNPHSFEDFKPISFQIYPSHITEDCDVVDESEDTFDPLVEENEDLAKLIVDNLGSLFLKLESIYNVSKKCIDEIVEELQFITCPASGPVFKEIVQTTLGRHDCNVDNSVISDLVKNLCQLNPVSVALGVDGPFSTSHKRSSFFKEHFFIVEPVEYILDEKERKTFQYVPILQSLSQILNKRDIQEKVFKNTRYSDRASTYKYFYDGSNFRGNDFFSGDDVRLSLILYIDDFEVCNPLGTSRKKHKVTAVYWVLADVPSVSRSTLTSIYLAVLCKAGDAKRYGYSRVLEPLLTDLKSLEKDGLFVPCVGKCIKGTVFSVIADNLGAHSVGGFVESFSGSYVCRFCIGERSQFQELEVRAEAFPPRTKHQHNLHVQTALGNTAQTHCFGVKKQCAITDKLDYFHVTSGYPPDVLHDLLEGIVPVELALCLDILIKKKYFSFAELNSSITHFSYKWSDKTNCPQPVPLNFASRKSIGGNAHENWCLLRLLPFMVGLKVPEDDKAWQLLMTLKDIVELAMSPIFTDESIGFLDSKIAEHRSRFFEVLPQQRLIPKHHFLEHYPQLIKAFGPLVALWTMRFEAKHSFFKKIVRQTNCFRNILMSLAKKHQSMIAYHLHDSKVAKPALSVSKTSRVPLEVLKEDIKESVTQKFPKEAAVHLANKVDFFGTNYCVGMMLPFGSTGGLPDFAEILQMIIVRDSLFFVVKLQSAWYNEHLRSFKLESTGNIQILEQPQMTDVYPLAAYTVAGERMVSLKHHICLSY